VALYGLLPGGVEANAHRGVKDGDLAPLLSPPAEVPAPYGWLRSDDRSAPEVLEHLAAENTYADDVVTAPLAAEIDAIYNELLARVKETDSTDRVRRGGFEYFSRTQEGQSYRRHVRIAVAEGGGGGAAAAATETLLLDENALAAIGKADAGKGDFMHVSSVTTSPSHELCAYTVDWTGDEVYDIVVFEVATGLEVDRFAGTAGRFVWGADDSELLYTVLNERHRSCAVRARAIAARAVAAAAAAADAPPRLRHDSADAVARAAPRGADRDPVIVADDDELFVVSVGKCLENTHAIITCQSKDTSEVTLVPLARGEARAAGTVVVRPRETGLLYDVDLGAGTLWITTNEGGASNFKLVTAPLTDPAAWTDVAGFGPRRDRMVAEVQVFRDFVAVEGREDGLPQVWFVSTDHHHQQQQQQHRVEWPGAAFDCSVGANREFEARTVRLIGSSMVVPKTYYDYDVAARTLAPHKVTEVPGYDPSLYVSQRISVPSRDGQVSIPMHVLFRRDLHATDPATGEPVPAPQSALHLYGYGAYGICIDPSFSSRVFPLVDRGIVYVIANIRGGGELGDWYYREMGRLLTKKNAFDDFVTCADALVERGWTVPARLSIEGRSAGGLLMGAVVNMRPELFRAVLAGVPFVDVIATMSDERIPLTTEEFEEIGNTNEAAFYRYVSGYSPVDNVREGVTYPAICVTCGLHDPRVAYWEPAKWVATLRHKSSADSGTLVVKTDMSAGHFSASDRYKYLKEKAWEYAFLLREHNLLAAASKSS
jgi:oligopeptidase B